MTDERRSPIFKRVASLVCFVAIGFAGWWAYQLLPGAGGLANELHWLLAMPDAPTKRFNQAITLTATVHQYEPEKAVAAYRAQIHAKDTQRRAHALYFSSFLFGIDQQFANTFFEWFRATPKEVLIADARQVAACYLSAAVRSDNTNEYFDELTRDDVDWLIVAVTEEPMRVNVGAAFLLLRAVDHWPDETIMNSALYSLAGNTDFAQINDLFPNVYTIFGYGPEGMTGPEIMAKVLTAKLNSEISAVRRGALRLLAAHGDEPAMATLRDQNDVLATVLEEE